ncbi:MAG: O-antigen ligase family protein [Salinibacter sp.]
MPFIAQFGLGVVVGLGILSSTLAPAPGSAFLELSHFVLLFVAAGVVAAGARSFPRLVERILLGFVVLSAGLYAVRFFVGYGVALSLPELQIGRETLTGYKNIRFFNQYQTWTLPLLVGVVAALPKKWRSVQAIVLGFAALWWTLIFATNVRGTVVAVALAGVGVWLLFRETSYRWLAVQAAALLAGGLLYYVLFTPARGATPQVVERLGDVGQSRRLQHWRKCLHMVWNSPLLGGGPMHYAWPPFDFARAAHPHNAFIQWLSEWGVPSTAIMSGLTVWGGWSWLRQEQDDSEESSTSANAVRVSLVAAVLAGTTHAMVSGVLVMPLSQMMLVLVGGWAWGRYRHRDSSRDLAVSARSQVVLAVLLVGAMAVVGTSLRDLSTIEERRSAFLEAVERRAFSPRYWQQGYIGVRDSSVIERARREW